jgi:hypothetical protein
VHVREDGMRKAGWIGLAALGLATGAFGQGVPPPSPTLGLDNEKAQMKMELGQALQQIGQYELRIIQLQKELEDAKTAKPAGEDAKTAKPAEPPK